MPKKRKTRTGNKIGEQYLLEFNDRTVGYYKSKKSLNCAIGRIGKKLTKNRLAKNYMTVTDLSGVNIGNKKFRKC